MPTFRQNGLQNPVPGDVMFVQLLSEVKPTPIRNQLQDSSYPSLANRIFCNYKKLGTLTLKAYAGNNKNISIKKFPTEDRAGISASPV